MEMSTPGSEGGSSAGREGECESRVQRVPCKLVCGWSLPALCLDGMAVLVMHSEVALSLTGECKGELFVYLLMPTAIMILHHSKPFFQRVSGFI